MKANIEHYHFVEEETFNENESKLRSNILRVTHFNRKYRKANKPYMFSQIALPAFNENEFEFWDTPDKNVTYESIEDFEIARSPDRCLLRSTAYEHPSLIGDNRSPLARASYEAYKVLFEFINKHHLGNLVRIWNYIPQILAMESETISLQDRERYRQFNEGRTDAWADFGPRDAKGELMRPSATGINAHNGPVVIECLTSQYPVHYIENPRQTPAYKYPPKYGSRAPAFARGTLLMAPNGPEMYVAGTASIVGSETVHIGDPLKQADEALKNIEVLISKENLAPYGCEGFTLDDLHGIRVYIKHIRDYFRIRKEVEKILGENRSIAYVHTDICRPDLLLEIEAVSQK